MELPVAGARRCLNSVVGNYSIATKWCRLSGLSEQADSSPFFRFLLAVVQSGSNLHKTDVEFKCGATQLLRC